MEITKSPTPKAEKESLKFTYLREGTEKRTAPIGDRTSSASGKGFISAEEAGTYFVRHSARTRGEMVSYWVHKVVGKGDEVPQSIWVSMTNANKDGYKWRMATSSTPIKVK